jgi:hypothetical protein
MDVFGKHTDDGADFRRNIPWWGAPADFLAETYPDLTAARTCGYSDDGDGFDAEGAK